MRHVGRRDAELSLDAPDRLVRILSSVEDPGAKKDVVEDLRLASAVASAGIGWPRSIAITWDGTPYFDLGISHFEALPRFIDPRLSTPL